MYLFMRTPSNTYKQLMKTVKCYMLVQRKACEQSQMAKKGKNKSKQKSIDRFDRYERVKKKPLTMFIMPRIWNAFRFLCA